MVLRSDLIKQIVCESGFSLCGIARSKYLPAHHARLQEWLDQGYHSRLDYLSRNIDKRTDPSLLAAGAKTVVVCCVNYKNEAFDLNNDTLFPKIASYAYARDYHKVLKEMLREAAAEIKKLYENININCYTDSAPILEKAWAVEAGLGWIGKNSLLITPQFGSLVLLGELVIDADADTYDVPYSGIGCGSCDRCVKSCPTGAINAGKFTLDTSKCISRLTTQRRDASEITDTLSTRGWIFGCDECQMCCPYNKAALPHSNTGISPIVCPASISYDEWKTMSEAKYKELFSRTSVGFCSYEDIMTNLQKALKDIP